MKGCILPQLAVPLSSSHFSQVPWNLWGNPVSSHFHQRGIGIPPRLLWDANGWVFCIESSNLPMTLIPFCYNKKQPVLSLLAFQVERASALLPGMTQNPIRSGYHARSYVQYIIPVHTWITLRIAGAIYSLSSQTPVCVPAPDLSSQTPVCVPAPDLSSQTPVCVPAPDLSSQTPVCVPAPDLSSQTQVCVPAPDLSDTATGLRSSAGP